MQTVMQALFDIKTDLRTILGLLVEDDDEERAEWEARTEKTLRMLQERIDYYEKKLGPSKT